MSHEHFLILYETWIWLKMPFLYHVTEEEAEEPPEVPEAEEPGASKRVCNSTAPSAQGELPKQVVKLRCCLGHKGMEMYFLQGTGVRTQHIHQTQAAVPSLLLH